MQGVKQHDSAVGETRDRDKPKNATVANGVFDGPHGAAALHRLERLSGIS